MSNTTFSAAEHQYLVDNVERAMIDQVINSKPSMVRSLYKQVPWTVADGDRVTFNAVAYETFSGGGLTENQNYENSKVIAGDELTKLQIQYGRAFEITRRMFQFAERNLNSAMEGGRKVVDSINNQLDLEMTQQIFGEADQLTMTALNGTVYNLACADGVALASASHNVNGTATTWSNILAGAGALNEANLTALIEQLQNQTIDDYGTNMIPNPKTLVIPQNQFMERAAFAIFGSELRPDTSATRTNAANIYQVGGGWEIVVLKYGAVSPLGLASSDNRYRWMILDRDMASNNFQYQVAAAPQTEVSAINEYTGARKVLATAFAAYAAVRAQGTGYSLSTTQPA